MKPKNIMLLGFVNRAVEYLDEHLEDENNSTLDELKSIDLASLKDELSENLDASLGIVQSTMTTLLHAGGQAFDKFIDNHSEYDTFSDQVDRIFDVDLLEEENTNSNEENLNKLLAFYNLNDDFGFGDDEVIPIEEESKQLDEEETSMMETIARNVSKNNEPTKAEPVETSEESKLDSIFDEIVANEGKPVEPVVEEEEKVQEPDIEEKPAEPAVEEESIEPTVEEEPASQIEEEVIDNSKVQNKINDIVEDIISKPVSEEPKKVEVQQEVKKETEEPKQEYVSTLIDDLRKQMIEEDEIKRNEKIRNDEIYEHIHKIYPYLSSEFILSVYALKDDLAKDYPLNAQIVILHRIRFNSVENLRQFVEITMSHEYLINADEDKLIVDVFKQFENTDGKILNNIFEIANQGYLLDGTYEGYQVLVNEEE